MASFHTSYPQKYTTPAFVSFFQNITLEGTGKTVTGISVIFRGVTLFTSGLYGCEASANPSFHTQLVRKRMTVLGMYRCDDSIKRLQKINIKYALIS